MEKTLAYLLVLASSATLVLGDNTTRTAKLEILRSPTKVAIWKPDPYPILRSYGDELPMNNWTIPTAGNQEQIEDDENIDNGSLYNSTQVGNFTMTAQTAKNMTCIKRDYENDLSAVFNEEAGPIETAKFVFNSTVPYFEGRILNITDISEPHLLKETIVDCDVYFNLNSTVKDHS